LIGRLSATVTAESAPDGTLSVLVRALDGATGFLLERVVLTLTVSAIDADVVRLSLVNPRTNTIAYFQGAQPVHDLAREIDLRVVP
jgi:hypothetical protein